MEMVYTTSVSEPQLATVKLQVLQLAHQSNFGAVYVSNKLPVACDYKTYELVAGIGCKQKLHLPPGQVFTSLQSFAASEWIFGYLGYDCKNEIENLTSQNKGQVVTDEAVFFIPETIIEVFPNGQVCITGHNPQLIWEQLLSIVPPVASSFRMDGSLSAVMNKKDYLAKVARVLYHIKVGDVYELNLCQEFYGLVKEGDPLATFLKLNEVSPMPFAAFLKLDNTYLLGASPERFLSKTGNKLVSQPIKGTTRRGKTPQEDKDKKTRLLASEKERAENLMIVDLVRNDLSRSCRPGSVRVEELFGVYSFQRVHQMISTVSGEMEKSTPWWEAIKNAFPMGSMTGAPKVMAMQLIEQLEWSKRGIYSGAVGYLTPEKDFDFNVVIRSIVYRSDTKKLSFQVGGAITWDSVAEAEYEECMLKAQAIRQVLEA
jgi:para-aminobenzoate synthetase component 1